jgi:hypothetical protein
MLPLPAGRGPRRDSRAAPLTLVSGMANCGMKPHWLSARSVGCAKRNNFFTQNRRLSSRGSSLYGLQKSAREVDLGVDPEEQLPGVIPGPIQPKERVITGTLPTKPPPIPQKSPEKCARAGDKMKGIRGLMIRNEYSLCNGMRVTAHHAQQVVRIKVTLIRCVAERIFLFNF